MSNLPESVNSLAEIKPINKTKKVMLEITINHPRTKPFERMTKNQQMSLLNSLYFKARATIPYKILEDTVRFEESADGCMHLHAYTITEVILPYIPKGLIMGFAKAVIHAMPVRTHQQLSKYEYSSCYEVYKSPAVLVQLTGLEDMHRFKMWSDYINKNALPRSNS